MVNEVLNDRHFEFMQIGSQLMTQYYKL